MVNDVVKKNIKVSGIANITGGGITENIPRIIPKDLAADIDLNGWKFPRAFQWLQEKGKISNEDMLRIFNIIITSIFLFSSAAAENIRIFEFTERELSELEVRKVRGADNRTNYSVGSNEMVIFY